MAKSKKHTTAFVLGTLLGGAAATGAAIWNSPQAGAKTRQQIVEKVESTIFSVLGSSDTQIARVLTPEQPAPAVISVAPEPV